MHVTADYFSHDAEYRRRKAAGRSGWDTGESLQLTFNRLDNFIADLPATSEPALLELGCGAGDLGLRFADQGWRVFGVDISPTAIAWAEEKAAAARLAAQFFIRDVTREMNLSIPPVDLVLDGHCLHCIIGADRQMFFRNARMALKAEGILHINTMCGDPHHPEGRRQFDPFSRCIIGQNGIAQRYFGRPEIICEEVVTAGFKIVKKQIYMAHDETDEDCLLISAVRS